VELVDGRYVITLPRSHHLTDGDKVRLILEKGADMHPTVKLVNDASFSIPADKPIDTKVFVYGKQHDDVRMVDYDAISMLNVSATQELAKEVEVLQRENSKQGAEISALKAANEKLTAVESENAELKAEMQALKKAVTKIQEKENGGVGAVALRQ
jgi:hypothetical protein